MTPTARHVALRLIAAAALLAAAGCTSANQPLGDRRLPTERRAQNATRAATGVDPLPVASRRPTRFPPTARPLRTNFAPDVHPDGCFVGLALSGGGSRSANFSAACMFQLQRINILPRVDYLSTVSGGSLTGWDPLESTCRHASLSIL